MEEPFVHLHVHSYYSMMQGVISPDELCGRAAELGFKYMALTDVNGLYGLMNFLDAARRHDICPIVGACLRTRTGCAVILVKTARGYELLCELITQRHLDKEFSIIDGFPPNAVDDLALLSPDAGILQALRSRAECWVEVVPGPSDRSILKMASNIGIPPVATNAAYFAGSDGHPLHRLLRAIDLNKTLSTLPPEEVVRPDRWLKPASDMAAQFPSCPEALNNADAVLRRRCDSSFARLPAATEVAA
jgi:error-prone DNA polymerase